MNSFLDLVKSRWAGISQAAVWILSILSTFMIVPPVINYQDSNSATSITSFILAGVIGLAFIPIKKKSSFKNHRLWQKVAGTFFCLFLIFFGFYFVKSEAWTIDYAETGIHLVIGDKLTTEKQNEKARVEKEEGKSIADLEFVKYWPGQNDTLWDKDLLQQRLYTLRVTYVLTVLVAALFIITLLQSILCYEQKQAL